MNLKTVSICAAIFMSTLVLICAPLSAFPWLLIGAALAFAWHYAMR